MPQSSTWPYQDQTDQAMHLMDATGPAQHAECARQPKTLTIYSNPRFNYAVLSLLHFCHCEPRE